MDLADITRINIYTTKVDEALKHFDVLGGCMGLVGMALLMSLLGVNRLVSPNSNAA